MRTGTFSNPDIVKVLNEKFVCAWVNKTPDASYELLPPGWPGGEVYRGRGISAVTSVFCSPDGTVIHAMPGFLDVIDFKRNLTFARDLHARLYDPRVQGGERFGIHADAHLKAAESARFEWERSAHRLQALKWMWTEVMPLTLFDRIRGSG